MGHLCVQTIRIPCMGYVTHRARDLSSSVLFPSSLFISPLFHQSGEYLRHGRSIPRMYTLSFYHSWNHHSPDISHTSSKDMQWSWEDELVQLRTSPYEGRDVSEGYGLCLDRLYISHVIDKTLYAYRSDKKYNIILLDSIVLVSETGWYYSS
jgi:hypothetical protein